MPKNSLEILGSKDLDLAQVDRSTLRFGPDAALPVHPFRGHPIDFDADGFTDRISHYRIQAIGLERGEQDVCLSGALLDGAPFDGCNSVIVIDRLHVRR